MRGSTPNHSTPSPLWWKIRSGAVFLSFMAIAAFFLITEYQAHVLGALPLYARYAVRTPAFIPHLSRLRHREP